MRTRMKVAMWLISVLLIAGLVINFGGCMKDNGMLTSPQTALQTSNKQPRFLKPKVKLLYKPYFTEKTILTEVGGSIKVGDETVGYTSISFPVGFISDKDSVLISFTYEDVGQVAFGPPGLQFQQPVTVAISYKNADLTGINEDLIRVYYYQESDGEWQYIGGEVDKINKVVKGDLLHFSRYALAAE